MQEQTPQLNNQMNDQDQQQPPQGKADWSKPKTWVPVVAAAVIIIVYLVTAAQANIWPFAPVAKEDQATNPALSEVEGWQTYRNEEFGFEFRYPSGWLVQNSNGRILFTSPETKAATEANAIACNDGNDATPCNSEPVSVDVVFSAESTDVTPDTEIEIVFNGISFIQYEALGLYAEKHYKTAHDGATLDFTAYNKPILDQILSTFNFTGSTASDKPMITNSSGSIIQGKTKANYLVWAYAAGQTCLTRNHMATYGAGKADANGNFSINIPIVVATGNSSIVVAAFPESSTYIKHGSGGTDSCFPASNISDPVTFNFTR